MSSRLFAAVLIAALAASGCQPPSTSPAAGAGVLVPAKGMAVIKGFVTSAGVIAAGGGNVIAPSGGNVIAPGGGNYALLQAAGGTPVGGANVQVQGGPFTGELVTGPDGGFAVQVPGGATYTVVASHSDGKGGLLKQVAVVEVPQAEEPPIVDIASLVTRRTGSIQGLVRLEGGADPEGADVFIPGTSLVGKVGAKGRFALANIPEGTWNVIVQKPGFKRAALTDLSVEAGRPLVISEPVTLAPGEAAGAGLKAVVRDAQGRAVVGAQLTAFAAGGQSYTATSDDQGNVAITGLPAGDYQIQLYRPFYQVPPRKPVTIADGASTDLGTLTLASTVMHFGQIKGRVVDEAGEPVDGAVVQLDPPVAEAQFTDANGHFTIDRVMPGEYTLSAAAGGFEVASRDVMLENRPGAVAALDEGLALRQPFDPAKPKAHDRKVDKLLPPVAKGKHEGEDLVIEWEPVGLPAGVTGLIYDLEGQVMPGLFIHLATTTGNRLVLKGFGRGPAVFRLIARASGPAPASYQVLESRSIDLTSVSGITVGNIDLATMDIETALMAVQSQRSRMLETQLKAQIEEVQKKNQQIGKLNELLGTLNGAAATFKSDARAEDKFDRSASAAPRVFSDPEGLKNFHKELQENGLYPKSLDELGRSLTKGEIDQMIQAIKGKIDSLSNSQQMDMIRLQSLSNKRNEAFDIMTNFIKKMQDSRSSIIGNMR